MRILRISIITFLLFTLEVAVCSAACSSSGTTLTAASPSTTDVSACLSIATSSTTLITIPAGTSHWSSSLSFTVPSGSANLTIAGSTSCVGSTPSSCADNTVIIDDFASQNPILTITTDAPNSKFTMKGITFQGGSAGTNNDKYSGIVAINGNSQNVRMTQMHWDVTTYSPALNSAGTRWTGCTYGVIDHIVWNAPTVSAPLSGVNNALQQYNQGTCYSDALGVGDQAWAHATSFGTANAIYVENSTFNNGFANDCTLGGSFVFRFNTFNASGAGSTLQTHPTGGDPRWRGCRQWEVYKNTWVFSTSSTTFMNSCIFVSSGTGLTWGNTIPSSSANSGTGCKQLLSVESILPNNDAYPQTPTPNGWGYCGTSSGLTGQGSAWNGSTTGSGYPCLDQPGRGKGDLLLNGFPNTCNGTLSPGCSSFNAQYPREALEPLYEVLDAYSAIPSNTTNVYTANAATGTTFNDNADIYHWCNASVDPALANGCTSAFTGSVGTGSGTLASRPTACTAGTAYWATDQGSWNNSGSGGQGQLYKCTVTGNPGTWSLFYTPEPYPHPLVSGANPSATPTLLISENSTGINGTWTDSESSCSSTVTTNCVNGYTETLISPNGTATTETVPGTATGYNFSPGGNLTCGTWNVSLAANLLDSSGNPAISPSATASVSEPCPVAQSIYPLPNPCRAVDTRNPNGPLGGPTLLANTGRDFPLLSSNCGIPSTALSYALNVTAVPNSGGNGWLTVWPTGNPMPNTSAVNWTNGLVTGNFTIVPSGTNGSVSIYSNAAPSNVVVDLVGYLQ